MRPPHKAGIFLGVVLLLAVLCVVCAGISTYSDSSPTEHRLSVVRTLKLADLALWYEATYTRHPSQTDRFAPFGDFPGALEHFPSGSMAPPPPAENPTVGTP